MTVDKVFREGRKAFFVGNLGNPYNPDTYRHREFERGFNSAYFENLSKVKQREQRSTTKGRS